MELYNAIAKLDKGGDANETVEVSFCRYVVLFCSELRMELFWGLVDVVAIAILIHSFSMPLSVLGRSGLFIEERIEIG